MLYKLFAIGATGLLAVILYACFIVASNADDQNDKHMKDLDDNDK